MDELVRVGGGVVADGHGVGGNVGHGVVGGEGVVVGEGKVVGSEDTKSGGVSFCQGLVGVLDDGRNIDVVTSVRKM